MRFLTFGGHLWGGHSTPTVGCVGAPESSECANVSARGAASALSEALGEAPASPRRRTRIAASRLSAATWLDRRQEPALAFASRWPHNRTVKKASQVVVGAFLGAVTLAGCTSPEEVSAPASPTQAGLVVPPSPEDPYSTRLDNGLITYDPVIINGSYPAMLARFQGELELVDGCLGMNGRPFIFPSHLVEWDGTTFEFGGESYQLGDMIVAGGGELPAGDVSEDIVAACGGNVTTFVLASG